VGSNPTPSATTLFSLGRHCYLNQHSDLFELVYLLVRPRSSESRSLFVVFPVGFPLSLIEPGESHAESYKADPQYCRAALVKTQ
jgi:hypothetical protein